MDSRLHALDSKTSNLWILGFFTLSNFDELFQGTCNNNYCERHKQTNRKKKKNLKKN